MYASVTPTSYPRSLHDALPILPAPVAGDGVGAAQDVRGLAAWAGHRRDRAGGAGAGDRGAARRRAADAGADRPGAGGAVARPDRKSTRLNSSHLVISYAVFCLK